MFENLPRSTTRTGYATVRGHQRSCDLSREERGLPQHPANGFIPCPSCKGLGTHTRNDSLLADPQCEYTVACGECVGTGEVQDGLIDPLELMRTYRAGMFAGYMSERREADRRHYYNLYRMRAVRRSSGLAAADMLARAQMCANDMARALQQVAA